MQKAELGTETLYITTTLYFLLFSNWIEFVIDYAFPLSHVHICKNMLLNVVLLGHFVC